MKYRIVEYYPGKYVVQIKESFFLAWDYYGFESGSVIECEKKLKSHLKSLQEQFVPIVHKVINDI